MSAGSSNFRAGGSIFLLPRQISQILPNGFVPKESRLTGGRGENEDVRIADSWLLKSVGECCGRLLQKSTRARFASKRQKTRVIMVDFIAQCFDIEGISGQLSILPVSMFAKIGKA